MTSETSSSTSNCYYSDDYDSGIVSSNLSSLSAISFDLENQQLQNDSRETDRKDLVIEELKKKIVDLHVELSNRAQNEVTLNNKLQEFSSELTYLRKSCDSYKAMLYSTRIEKNRLTQEVLAQKLINVDSKRSLNDSDVETGKWKVKFERLQQENEVGYKRLNEKIQCLENSVKLDQIKSELYSKNLVTLNNENSTEKQYFEDLVVDLRSSCRKYESAIDKLKKEMLTLQRENEGLETIIDNKTSSVTQLEQLNCQLRGNLENLQTENEIVEKDLEFTRSEKELLVSKIENYRREKDDCENATRIIKESFVKFVNNYNVLHNKNDKLESSQIPKEVVTKLRNRLKTLEDKCFKIKELCNRNEVFLKNLDRVKFYLQENAKLKTELAVKDIVLKDKINRYETSNHTLLRKVKEYRNEKHQVLKQLTDLQKQLYDYSNLQTTATNKNSILETQLNNAKFMIIELSNKVLQLESELSRKDLEIAGFHNNFKNVFPRKLKNNLEISELILNSTRLNNAGSLHSTKLGDNINVLKMDIYKLEKEISVKKL